METLEHQIHLVDTHYLRPEQAAAWLLVSRGRAAFVECNTTLAVPRLLAALDALDLPRSAVDYLVVTHVHLDHAGGAGALLRELPAARLVVHPQGARHLVDPTRLIAGATAVYGEERMRALYGEIVPVPDERVLEAQDGWLLDLAGRELVMHYTPGHARHHLALQDAASGGVFTGDVFGLGYRALATPSGPFLFPSTAPTQFDPLAMKASIQHIAALAPPWLYLTHYGPVGRVDRQAAVLIALLEEWMILAEDVAARVELGAPQVAARAARLRSSLLARYRAAGGALDQAGFDSWTALDLDINAQGLAWWLHRRG